MQIGLAAVTHIVTEQGDPAWEVTAEIDSSRPPQEWGSLGRFKGGGTSSPALATGFRGAQLVAGGGRQCRRGSRRAVGVGTGKRELAGSRGEMMEQGETWTRASRAPHKEIIVYVLPQ